MALSGKIALVTGASRGVGKGIALQLGEAGATVYITGRTLDSSSNGVGPGSLKQTAEEINIRGGKGIPIACDHSKDDDIEKVFQQIAKDHGRLDILINNAYSAVPALFENFGKPFWEIPENIWDDINGVGLRNHYICAVKAAKMMVNQQSGLIVNISSVGRNMYLMTPAYGTGKAAIDRMAADCALELQSHNVTFIGLAPGFVNTEMETIGQHNVTNGNPTGETARLGANAFVLDSRYRRGESIEFSGKCIVALAQDENLLERTGKVFETAEIGNDFNFVDVDVSVLKGLKNTRGFFLRIVDGSGTLSPNCDRFLTGHITRMHVMDSVTTQELWSKNRRKQSLAV